MQYAEELYIDYKSTFLKDHSDNLEQLTQEQALNKSWFVHRAGRVTASVASEVARMKKSPSLVSKIMQYKEFSSIATEYGNKHEKNALDLFIEQESPKHHFLSEKEWILDRFSRSLLGSITRCYDKVFLSWTQAT